MTTGKINADTPPQKHQCASTGDTKPSVQNDKIQLIDKRLPTEVWEQIFCYLYPSQLSRLSMVSKTFYTIVCSLAMWSRLFTSTFGPKKRLRPLIGISESKSYMLYLCASSLHICENCNSLTKYEAGLRSGLPLLVLVPAPTQSTDEVEYLGERLNEDWYFRMCLSCRQALPAEPVPREIANQQRPLGVLQQMYPGYVLDPHHSYARNQLCREIDALRQMRQKRGGDVGIEASKLSAEDWDDKTRARIKWYRQQD